MSLEPKYDYSDVKLTCPFCKSEMLFDDVLVGAGNLPYYMLYYCDNDKCRYEMEITFDEFEKRIK